MQTNSWHMVLLKANFFTSVVGRLDYFVEVTFRNKFFSRNSS